MSSPKVIVDATPVVKVSYGLPGPGVPKGGSFPKVLKKLSSTDYDAEWGEPYQVYLDVEGGTVATNMDVIGRVLHIVSATPQGGPAFGPCNASQAETFPPVGVFAGGTAAQPEIITHGVLYGVNTIGFSIGDRLYVGVLGALTSTPPSENAFHVATVLKVASSGSIFVNISNVDSSFEGLAQNKIWVGNSSGVATQVDAVLTSLADVSSSMSPSNGEILRYQSGEWNSSSLTLSDTGLAQLTAKHIYVGDSNNETVSTDVLNVDVTNNRVGIVEALPNEALGVFGRMQLVDGTRSVMIGDVLPASSGNANVIIGFEAASLANSLSNTVAIGAQAALKQTGTSNIAIGVGAMEGPSGAGNTASGDYNIAIGHRALEVHDSGGTNVALGPFAFRNLQGGFNNVAIGNSAGYETTTVSGSTLVGSLSGYFATGGSNTLIGSNAGYGQTGASTFEKTVAVGSSALALLTIGEGNTAVGFESFGGLTAGNRNTSLGYQSGSTNSLVNSSTAIGYQAAVQTAGMSVGAFATGLTSATALGYQAVGGFNSVAVGRQSQTASNAVSIGNESVSRGDSVSVGYKAGNNLGGSSLGGNTLVGWSAGRGDSSTTSQYNNNTAIGWSAGRLLDSGSGNVLIGYAAGQSLTDESNQLHINNSIASSGAPLIYGEFDNQYVKINGSLEVTSSGKIGTTLEVVGDIISTNDEDITLMPDGFGHVVMGNYEFDVDQPVGQATDEYILAYDDSDGTIRLKENIIEVTGATSVTTPIQNDELVVIPAGTPVYAKGETQGGARTLVGIADASNPNKMPAIGVAATELQPSGTLSDGDAIVMGDFDVTISVPYSGLEPNDVLYVAVGGGLPTQTKPTGASNLIQNIGVVLKTNGASGTQCKALKVSCIGRSNDVPNIAEDNVWVGNAAGVATPTTLADVAFSGDYTDLTNTPTDEHIGNTNLTLDADRVLTQSTNRLQFAGVDVNGASVTMLDSNPGQGSGASLLLHGNSLIVGSQAISANKLSFFRENLQVGDGQTASGSVGFRSTPVGSALFGNTMFFQAPTQLANNDAYTLPPSQPSSTQFLSSDSSGNMSWATPVDTNTNIGNTDLTLSDNRVLQLNGNNLAFRDGSTDKLEYVASVGVWSMIASLLMTGDFSVVGDSGFLGAVSINGNNGGGGPSGELRLTDNSGVGGTSVGISAPATLSSDITFTLPNNTGNSNDALITDGAGNLSWAAQSGGLSAVQDDTAPTLGGDLDVYDGTLTNLITTSKVNGDISIQPNGTGNVFLGDLEFDSDQGVGSNLDNYVLTFDAATRRVSLEPPQGGLTITGTPAVGEVPFVDSAGNLETDTTFSYSSSSGLLSMEALGSDKIQKFQPSPPQGQQLAVGAFGRNSEVISKVGTSVQVAAGRPYALDGSWTLTDAATSSRATKMLAIASASGASSGVPMVMNGAIRLDSAAIDNTFASASVGDPVYLKDSGGSQAGAGILTCTAPASQGLFVRVVGYVLNTSLDIIYFDPDNTWIEL